MTPLDFVAPAHGSALTSRGVRGIDDAGMAWNPLHPAGPALTEIDFVGAEQGWGLAASGLVSTADGELMWTALALAAFWRPELPPCQARLSVVWRVLDASAVRTVLQSTDAGEHRSAHALRGPAASAGRTLRGGWGGVRNTADAAAGCGSERRGVLPWAGSCGYGEHCSSSARPPPRTD